MACGRSFDSQEGIADFLAHSLDPRAEEHRNYREEWASEEATDYGSSRRDAVEIPWALRRLHALPGERVLDLACGKGRLGLTLLKKVPGLRLVGADFCRSALTWFMRRAKAAGVADSLQLVCADAARLPFSPGTFHRVLCSMLIPCFETDVARNILDELARVLVPGGTAIITVLNYGRKARRLGYQKAGYFPGTQAWCRLYDAAELSALVGGRFEVMMVDPLVQERRGLGSLRFFGWRMEGKAFAIVDPLLRRLPHALDRAGSLGLVARSQIRA
jgi:SAM-dependent methyltransferase